MSKESADLVKLKLIANAATAPLCRRRLDYLPWA